MDSNSAVTGGTQFNPVDMAKQIKDAGSLRQLRNAENSKRIANQAGSPLRNAPGGNNNSGNAGGQAQEGGSAEDGRSYADIAGENRRKKAAGEKAGEEKKEESKTGFSIRAGTDKALRWAWMTIIPSWGLSLIYINTHVFLRFIFPDAFCKLGEEWIPKKIGTGEHSSKSVAGTAFGLAEIFGLLVMDLIFLSIIFGALAIISMIVGWMSKGLIDKVWSIAKTIWDMGWSGFSLAFKSLVDLFSR